MNFRNPSLSRCLLALVPALMGLPNQRSRAAIIATDDFETYTQSLALSDASQPAGGSGFAGTWSAPGAGLTATVVAGTMAAAGVNGGVNAVETAGITNVPVGARAFVNPLPDTFYVAALVRENAGVWGVSNTLSFYLSNSPTNLGAATPGAAGNTVLTFGIRNSGGATDFSNPNYAGTGSGGGGHFMIRLGTGSPPNAAAVIPASSVGTVTTGTDYYLVARYSKSASGTYDTVDLWLNPSSDTPTTPEATMTVATPGFGLTNITHIIARAAALQADDRPWFDRLTVATEWSDVVPPVTPPAPPVITSATRNPQTGDFSISWTSLPGRAYRIEASDTLVPEWGDLEDYFVADSELSSIVDSFAKDSPNRFYRVRLLPPTP